MNSAGQMIRRSRKPTNPPPPRWDGGLLALVAATGTVQIKKWWVVHKEVGCPQGACEVLT